MLSITVKGTEFFDEKSGEFHTTKDQVLNLEHSLISLSKWEGKYHKPFIGKGPENEEEMLDYVRCMTITQNVEPYVYRNLSSDNIMDIKKYMEDPMTATWFSDKRNPKTRQKTVTAELIYYWMFRLNIPIQFEKWHLNRLLTLIRLCNLEDAPKKKMKPKDIYKQNAELNRMRREQTHSNG